MCRCILGHNPRQTPFFTDDHSAEYDWLYSLDWAEVDNTVEGAIKRIEWLRDHGVPDNYIDQMNGKAPLCYA